LNCFALETGCFLRQLEIRPLVSHSSHVTDSPIQEL
jgi:hypothetical protein